jgi:hypothetical protein
VPAETGWLRRASQVLAVLCLAGILGTIVHKGGNDIARLAQKHHGVEFWVELARYFIGNLAGGGKRPDEQPGR